MITKDKQELLKYYDLGLTAYKQRKWNEAIKAFGLALRIDPNDGPSGVYLERSKTYQEKPPPEDWDGVFVMPTK
ncbi:MAG: tetratricopeptide repeat protein [Spirochaetota bacterium]|nr:tetratricopeptide repeat protein [Spirochaetota bacterium]